MDVLCGKMLLPSGHVIEQVRPTWKPTMIFGFLVVGYIFYLHDRAFTTLRRTRQTDR